MFRGIELVVQQVLILLADFAVLNDRIDLPVFLQAVFFPVIFLIFSRFLA